MKNKEKNLEILAQLEIEDKTVALKKGKLVDCRDCKCDECSFQTENNSEESCGDVRKRWAELDEDYPLDKQERNFLQFQCDHLTPAPAFIERTYLDVTGEMLEIKSDTDRLIAVFYGVEAMYRDLLFSHNYTLKELGLKSRNVKK